MYHFLVSIGLRHLTINNIVKAKYFKKDFKYLDKLVNTFHSFDDFPWNRLDLIERYMSMDRNFYFILTIRDPDEWFNSWVRFQKKRKRPIPENLVKSEFIQEELIDHNNKCIAMAQKYNKPLLIIDVTKDKDAPNKITNFLNLPKSTIQFPHKNRTK